MLKGATTSLRFGGHSPSRNERCSSGRLWERNSGINELAIILGVTGIKDKDLWDALHAFGQVLT